MDSWLTDTVTVVGGVVGAAGLGVGWFSARDTHWDRRYERLIAIEQEARARGPLTEGDTDASENAQAAHAQFLQNLDREIRTQQAAQLRAARRVTGGASTGPLLKTSVLPATDNPRSAINRVDWPTAVAATAERAEGCASHG